MTHEKKTQRRLQGVIVSAAMQKTVVVRVSRTVVHPKYGKRYRVSTRLKADDPQSEGKVGQHVTIEECRPLSRDKRWRVVEIQKD